MKRSIGNVLFAQESQFQNVKKKEKKENYNFLNDLIEFKILKKELTKNAINF